MLEMSKKKKIFYFIYCTVLLIVSVGFIIFNYTNGYPIGGMVFLLIGMLIAITLLIIK
ncbi:F0F1-type ATP synthase assembly protein I [Sporosarcina psychrophila]|uniref:F0F1-type ATP synthase assembly protein I n=1 Tax=Sporosarcina psychrophila TaxID=1476 RepID=A0ABV2K533_SPOPS